jgi:hypothetical protein
MTRGRLAAAAVLVLVLVPVVFAFGRGDDYWASVSVYPGTGVRPLSAWHDVLRDEDLRRGMRELVDARPAEYRGVKLQVRAGPPRIEVSVAAPTPARAADLANALGPLLAGGWTRRTGRRAVVGPRATAAPPRGVADRVADAFPGPLPGPPSPFWSGVAGLIVAGALWAGARVMRA